MIQRQDQCCQALGNAKICNKKLPYFFHRVLKPPPLPPPQPQILFKSRLGAHNVGNDCTMTIDGTGFRIPQKRIAKKGNTFASHKYAGKSTPWYELGVDIIPGNLVWIQGPYPVGNLLTLLF